MAKVVKITSPAKTPHKEVRNIPVSRRKEWEDFITWMRESLIGKIQYIEIIGEKVMSMTVYFSHMEDQCAFCLQFPE